MMTMMMMMMMVVVVIRFNVAITRWLTADIVSESRRQHDAENSGLSLAMMEHLICNFYLLISTYSHLPYESVRFARQFGLMRRLLTILIAQSMDQRVRFYRAKQRRAQLCHSMLSVRLSVCDVQVPLSRPDSLRYLLILTPTWSNGNTSKIRVE